MKKIDNGVFDFSTISFVDNNWSTLIMVVALLLLTINMVVYRRKFLLMLQSLYSKRAFSQLSKEGKLFSEGAFIFALPLILITAALCLQQLCILFFPALIDGMDFMQSFGLMCGGVAVFFLLRLIIDFFLFELFDNSEDRNCFHIIGFSFWLNCSLVFLLTAAVIQYTNFILFYWFILLVISLLFALKTYKIFVFKSQQVNLFRFFVYFCTLEILPYVIVVKLLFLYGN